MRKDDLQAFTYVLVVSETHLYLAYQNMHVYKYMYVLIEYLCKSPIGFWKV